MGFPDKDKSFIAYISLTLSFALYNDSKSIVIIITIMTLL